MDLTLNHLLKSTSLLGIKETNYRDLDLGLFNCFVRFEIETENGLPKQKRFGYFKANPNLLKGIVEEKEFVECFRYCYRKIIEDIKIGGKLYKNQHTGFQHLICFYDENGNVIGHKMKQAEYFNLKVKQDNDGNDYLTSPALEKFKSLVL